MATEDAFCVSLSEVSLMEPNVHAPAENTHVWLVVREAAQRARTSPRVIYNEVRIGRLRAAKVGGRRELRLRPEWIDAWLFASSTEVV